MSDQKTELDIHSTDSVQLYGAFLGSDDPGCQDYTKQIKLQGVRLVDEQWLLSVIAERDRVEQVTEVLRDIGKLTKSQRMDSLVWTLHQGRIKAVLSQQAEPAQEQDEREAFEAIEWLDDFVARCNGDDRGSCHSVNVIRAALTRPAQTEHQPVAWECRCTCDECTGADWTYCSFEQYQMALADPDMEARELYAAPIAQTAPEGPDYGDGPGFEGWAERCGDANLIEQRNLLLAALERTADYHVPGINPLSDAANLSAMDVISKVKGGAK